MTVLLSIIIVLLIGYFKGKQDLIIRKSKLKINEDFDYLAKYKLPLQEISLIPSNNFIQKLYKKYHEYYKLTYVERFPFSATALVGLTDKWHRVGFFRSSITILGFTIFIGIWWMYFVLYITYTIGFHISYTLKY